MLLGNQTVNAKGHLEIGGCDTIELVKEYGTPLYVMDEEFIRDNAKRYVNSFKSEYGNAMVAFASKAFIVIAMCKLIAEEGLWLDVASAGEFYTAKCAGFPMDKILFHGNFKSNEELEMAVKEGVCVVCDSLFEIDNLSKIAKKMNPKDTVDILIRCNPGVDPHTHSMISTGQEDSKFGVNIKSGKAIEAITLALSKPNLNLKGVHIHLGSQLLLIDPFIEVCPIMASFFKAVFDETGKHLEILDIGGGLGVRYTEDKSVSIEELAKVLSSSLKSAFKEEGLPLPALLIEPGRSITGEAGTTLYTIGQIKEVNTLEKPFKKYYLPVDGGLSDNPRPSLYGAKYTSLVANKANEPKEFTYSIVGRHCESDNLFPDTILQKAEYGDVLAVLTTGAYSHSMASNYNRFTRPAVVFVKNGKSRIVYRRETLEDLIKCDVK